MRRSRIVAALAIGPLALVLAGLVAHAPAMRWLRVHAEYDDTHPWEALEIVATLLPSPS